MYTSPSGKSYIGQTWNEKLRMWQHKSGKYSSRILSSAIKKYGFDNFKYEVIHSGITNQMELDMLEEVEIRNKNTLYPKGYNLKEGGGGRGLFTEESKRVMSEARKKMPAMTEETKAKISKSLKGVKKSKEHINKVRYKIKGLKRSEEQKERIREGRKHLSFKIICLENMKEYDSITDASKELCLSTGCISLCVSGKRPTAGGFHWIRADKYTEESKKNILSKKTKNDIIRQPVECVETGEIFKSITEANKKTGAGRGNIARCCKIQSYTAKGLHWRYYHST